jgi:prepilin peptidase CpaA
MAGGMTPLDCYAATAFSVVAAAFDLSFRQIPNVHVIAGAVAALALSVVERGIPGLVIAVAGAVVAAVLMMPAYLATAVAGGDVKTMAVIGAFAGPRLAFSVVMVTLIAGGFVALVWLVSGAGKTASDHALGRNQKYEEDDESTSESVGPAWRSQIPYGPVIALGALLTFYTEALP